MAKTSFVWFLCVVLFVCVFCAIIQNIWRERERERNVIELDKKDRETETERQRFFSQQN